MANQEHLDILKQGVEVWNQWRNEHTGTKPNLRGADLRKANLNYARLTQADLTEADHPAYWRLHELEKPRRIPKRLEPFAS